MSTTTSAFPSPLEISTPPGCEGWEEMYPHYTLFSEERRESDENRLWFWNSMHFPVPMPAFDVTSIDGPYYALGAWQNRAFAVPPAMGIEYRVVNSYIYISVNRVTDPAKIAERAEFFQKRAGWYFQNWDDLYGKWRKKMEALLEELMALEVPDLPEYEPDEVVFGDENPVRSALSYLRRRHDGAPVLLFAQPPVRERLIAEGVNVIEGEGAEVVLVLHVDDADFAALERAARARSGGRTR